MRALTSSGIPLSRSRARKADSAGGPTGTFVRGTWAARAPEAGIVANRAPSTERGINPEITGGRQPGS